MWKTLSFINNITICKVEKYVDNVENYVEIVDNYSKDSDST